MERAAVLSGSDYQVMDFFFLFHNKDKIKSAETPCKTVDLALFLNRDLNLVHAVCNVN